MARDETARETDDERTRFDRRSYLRLSGATAASLAALGTGAGATAAADYQTITVSAGETRTFRLESGDTLENVLIDITAEGAEYRIHASGDGWAIRNVGVTGVWDQYEKAEPIIVQVDAGGTGVIENLYLGDGAEDDSYPGATGIFVPTGHAGTLEIDRVNIQDFPDNAIYASAPGNGQEHPNPGAGGEVHITNSYAAGCRAANFRIGTDGSYVENCVSVNGDKGFWGYYEDTRLVDCDISGAPVYVGEDAWQKGSRATVTAENSRFDNVVTATGNNALEGESAGTPGTTPPDGVPLSAEAAASGNGGESDGGPGGDDSTDDTDDSDESDSVDGEYDTITVPAGETRVDRVGDGETFENKLVDITAEGASWVLRADGDDWTVRNVGVEGQDDRTKAYGIAASTNGGVGRIENLYFDNGGTKGEYPGLEYVYVPSGHSGTLEIDRVNIQNLGENAIRGDAPGNSSDHPSPGAGGEVHVTNAFTKHCAASHIRLGTEGSYAENCVSVGGYDPGRGSSAGFWAYYDDIEIRNCDCSGHPIMAGNSPYDKTATLTAENCRFTETSVKPGSEIHGESVGEPRTEPPESVPRSPEEAASGGSSTESPTTTDPEPDPSGTLLELISEPNTSNITYEFTVEGSVEKRLSGDDGAESGDEISDNGDGTVTVSGVAGNGYGDSFHVDGTVTSMDLDERDWTVRYGGDEVSVAELTLPNKLIVDGSDEPRRATTYTIEISGNARKSAALGSINAYDSISGGEISGRIIGGADGYRFSGDITGFTLDGPATVRLEDGS